MIKATSLKVQQPLSSLLFHLGLSASILMRCWSLIFYHEIMAHRIFKSKIYGGMYAQDVFFNVKLLRISYHLLQMIFTVNGARPVSTKETNSIDQCLSIFLCHVPDVIYFLLSIFVEISELPFGDTLKDWKLNCE